MASPTNGRGGWHGRGRERPSTTEELEAKAAGELDPKIIDGKGIAAEIRREIADEVEALVSSSGVTPGLAVVLVGSRKDSETYVRMKKKACQQVGIREFGFNLTAQVTQDELLERIQELNEDPSVHGILVQLPLPEHIDEQLVLSSIDPAKDVDGLHPLNMAQLTQTNTHQKVRGLEWSFGNLDFPVACTPQGCIELLDRCGVPIAGQRAVVIGRSNIVGIPVSLLLMQRDATVTIVHSHTPDPAAISREADIVIAAAGRAELVNADWVKPGAVVIDVGINSVEDKDASKGYRLVGDVKFMEVKSIADKITPVPGGVGPMTIAMLLRNTLLAAARCAAQGAGGGGAAQDAAQREREGLPPLKSAVL